MRHTRCETFSTYAYRFPASLTASCFQSCDDFERRQHGRITFVDQADLMTRTLAATLTSLTVDLTECGQDVPQEHPWLLNLITTNALSLEETSGLPHGKGCPDG